MLKKRMIFILVLLVSLFIILPGLQDPNSLNDQSPLQTIDAFNSTESSVLLPNLRVFSQDYLRLGINLVHYPSLSVKKVYSLNNRQIIVFYPPRFIVLFFIFYQIARCSSKQDDPVLMNGLSKSLINREAIFNDI